MASSAEQPLRSRRYGTALDPGGGAHPPEVRHTLDGLGSSVAAPPPGAMEPAVAPDAPSRTFFSTFDENMARRASAHGLASAADASVIGADDPFETSPAVRTLVPGSLEEGATGLRRSRSFLDAYRTSEARPWLEEDPDEEPEIKHGPAPASRRATVHEVEDEDAPLGPRIRTVLNSVSDESAAAPKPEESVPIASATAAALAKLTNEEAAADTAPIAAAVPEKKKKKKLVSETGEVVKKKKRDKDGKVRDKERDPTKRKKRVSTRVKEAPLAPLTDPPLEQPADDWMDEQAPTNYLDAMRETEELHAVPLESVPDAASSMLETRPTAPPEEVHAAVSPPAPVAVPLAPSPSPHAPAPPIAASEAVGPMAECVAAPVSPEAPKAPAVPVAPAQEGVLESPANDAPADVRAQEPERSETFSPPVPLEARVPTPPGPAERAPSRAAPIAEKWRKGQLDPDAMSIVSVSTYRAPTVDERRASPDLPPHEVSRIHVFNHNASRLAVNVFILYSGLFVMLRKLWRWERPWVTGSVAAFYLVVWWRGDLLAIFFLCTFLYIATFRWLHLPAEETFEPADASAPGLRRTLSNRSVMRRHHRLDLVTSQPLTVASSAMLQQAGDKILVYTHSLADVHERMKNLAMWRNPLATLRYLAWLLLFVVLSAHVTTWMMIKLPGALVFVCVFGLAPLIEHGYWAQLWEAVGEAQEAPPAQPFVSASRTVLDKVLAGVPTDEEYLQQAQSNARWALEREERRRGEYVDLLPNRIVEEEPEPIEAKVRRRKDPRTGKPSRRVLQRWQDATDVAEPSHSRAEHRTARAHTTARPRTRPVADVSGVFSDALLEAEPPAPAPSAPAPVPPAPPAPPAPPVHERAPQAVVSRRGYVLPDASHADASQRSGHAARMAHVSPTPPPAPLPVPQPTHPAPLETSGTSGAPAAAAAAAAPAQSTPLLPGEPLSRASDNQWEDMESVASEYDVDESASEPQPTAAERALAALGFGLPTEEPKPEVPAAPQDVPTDVMTDVPTDVRPAAPHSVPVAPAPPLFQVPVAEVQPYQERMDQSMRASGSVERPRSRSVLSAGEGSLASLPENTWGASAAAPLGADAAHAQGGDAEAPSMGPVLPPLAVEGGASMPHAPAPAPAHTFVAAQSDSLQEHIERRRRLKQVQQETLDQAVNRKASFASLATSQDGTAMSPAISVEAVHSRPGAQAATPTRAPARGIRWVDETEEQGIYLAVHRKRVGHLVVLPTRLVFQLTHSTIKPMTTPVGMSSYEFARLTKTVDGRTFYPLIAPEAIRAMVQAEMQGTGYTPFESYSVMASVMPEPHRIMFDAPFALVSGIKKTRKNTPVLDHCPEGLEIVLADSPKGLTLPAVLDRDRAFQHILAQDPDKWPA